MENVAIYRGFEKPQNLMPLLEKFYSPRSISLSDGNIIIKKQGEFNFQPLIRHYEIDLANRDWRAVAGCMMSVCNPEYLKVEEEIAQAQIKGRGNEEVYGGLGLLTDFKVAHIRAVANVHIRQDEFEKRLLPLLDSHFHFSKLCPVSLDVQGFGSLNAIQRIHILSHKHSLYEIEELMKREVSSGVNIRAGSGLLNFPDVYLQSINVFITSSIKIGFASYHFYREKPIPFDFVMRASLSSQFQGLVSPMTESIYPIPFLLSDGDMDVWQMLAFAIKCVNSIFSYAFDCFNFLSDAYEVNSSEQFQFSSAIYLLYADILSLNSHQDEYTKMKMALSALSKIANIIFWREKRFTEPAWFDSLFSDGFSKIVSEVFDTIENDKVRNQWVSISSKVYFDLSEKMEKIFPNIPLNDRMAKIRNMRNCFEHGAFLRGGQFEDIFYQTQGILPSEVVNLPIVLLVAMSHNPKKFFQLVSNINPS